MTGALAGCPLQVSGPAAGLTVIVFEIVDRLGFEQLGLVVLVAERCRCSRASFDWGNGFEACVASRDQGDASRDRLSDSRRQFHVMLDDKPPGSGAVNWIAFPGDQSGIDAAFDHQRRSVRSTARRVATITRDHCPASGPASTIDRRLPNTATTEATWSTLADEQMALVTRLSELSSPPQRATETEVMMSKQQAIADMQAVVAAIQARDRDAISKALQSAAEQLGHWHHGLKHPMLAGALGC